VKEIKYRLSFLIIIFPSLAFGSANFSCPTHIDTLNPLANLSNEWVIASNPHYASSKNNNAESGDFLRINLSIGRSTPFETLGSRIPNNELTGHEDGYWLWLLEGKQAPEWEVSIVCDFYDTDIVLLNVVKASMKECRNPIKDRKGINLIKCI